MTRRIGVLLCLVVAASAVGLLGGTSAAARNGHGGPFVARFQSEAHFTSPTTAVFNGSGWATYLGETTNSAEAVLDPPVRTWRCDVGWGIPNTHIETLTATNGDELVIEFRVLACPIGEVGGFGEVIEPIFHGRGVGRVIGGTGRFENARGRLVVDGEANFITTKCHWLAVGWIFFG